MQGKKLNPLGGNNRNEIWTPRWFLDQLRAERWKFGLDVCACAESSAADRYFTVTDNGLQMSWLVDSNEVVWCNPPFSQCRLWIEKAIEDARVLGTSTLMLLPANIGSKWFYELAPAAQSITIITPRLNYYQPPRLEPIPGTNQSMLVGGNRGKLMTGVAFSSCLWYVTRESAKAFGYDQEVGFPARIRWQEYRKPKGVSR